MFTNLFAVATSRTMGWFYVAFIEEFSLNRETSSWPGFLLMCCHRTSGLLVGMLHKHMSLFLIGLMGSFLAWGGMAASAFAPSISWMSFTMGIVHGIGAGVVIQSHTVVVLQHFSKYRGVAAGSMFTANPTSAILFPAVLSALNDAYGFRGAVLVYGALIMHISALCPILKEPPWITNAGTMRENGVHGNQRLRSTLVDYVNTVHIYTMVDYARDKGVSRTHATMSITYAAPPEILGRLLVPLIADMGWLSRPFLACGCAITAGLLFAVTPETVQITHLVLRALSSVTMGVLATMKTVLVADYMGTDAVCVVSGVSGSLLVPLMLCNPLIFGFFRDRMGSYDNLYRIVAGIILCGGLALIACLVRSSRSISTRVKISDGDV
ncbi:monocarboxylate transporter 11-like [Rhipicephalus sanguineus]|uniref:monocarboxylate transporter 11-like n=1 Tax=Rhipicephalus sanguineus TaxID=34632 RepID=UPI0020C414E0|nr:monocarboxylate transporter 11-like [Rhipicephalus sanguineus]